MPRRLSVLIPVHNEERTLERLLGTVEQRPEVYELVIVDDGSTDAAAEILRARSDLETCYKLMPLKLWRALDLQASGFEIEPEITAKLLKRGHRIFEVPISYAARSRAEGKKLTWRDGMRAVSTLTRIRVLPDRAPRHVGATVIPLAHDAPALRGDARAGAEL